MTTALITGVTGQDGSYLAEFLLAKGYEVHGVVRRSSNFGTQRIDHVYDRLHLHYGDVCDGTAMSRLVRQIGPDEVYNLAAQSHVRVSFDQPLYTADATGIGCLRMLEAVRDGEQACGKRIKFYQASSSEMFGGVFPDPASPYTTESVLREESPFRPRSPYACSKVFAHHSVVNYREAYGLFARCGILFNHESPRRGETFVTRKITRAVGRIKHGLQERLYLGNLNAKRDWGFAGDYVEAMWLMLQHDIGDPPDLVVATGECHTVREFCERAFTHAGLDYRDHVEHDPRHERPTEVDTLIGYAENARRLLGWEPRTTFGELVKMMVDADIELARREAVLARGSVANHDAVPAAIASVESVVPQPTTRGDSDRTDKAAPRPSEGTGNTQAEVCVGPDPDSRVWETHTPPTHATPGECSKPREGT